MDKNDDNIKMYSYELVLNCYEDGLIIKKPLKIKYIALKNDKVLATELIKKGFEQLMLAFDLEFDDKIGE